MSSTASLRCGVLPGLPILLLLSAFAFAQGPWETTYAPPPSKKRDEAVWTGSKIITWDGIGGVVIDLSANSWKRINPINAPSRRLGHTVVWTGTEMIVWGGDYAGVYLNDGARYNPSTDTWTPINTVAAPSPRSSHCAVWTGTEMIVWGGQNSTSHLVTGGRYNPSTDTWVPTSISGAPNGRNSCTAVWTGDAMVVWGGWDNWSVSYPNTGGRYYPSADVWMPMTITSAPSGRKDHTAVWSGTEMIVWGGDRWTGFAPFNTGGCYNPSTDRWRATTTTGAPSARSNHSAVWTGTEMVVWGGEDWYVAAPATTLFDTGATYNPSTDTWATTSTTGAPTSRCDHIAVWDGTEMLVWGGGESVGGRYDPAANSWGESVPYAYGPSVATEHTAVWTGSEMLLWGGMQDYKNTLNRYDPSTGEWTCLDSPSAPEGRSYHTAVWTGTEMVVWGGWYDMNSGGRFDPANNTWTTTSLAGAPAARWQHTAVWTGSEMIVWGGVVGGYTTYLDTGGRYDPRTDTWSSTSLTNAPSGRYGHVAVWTGTEMIVWGGINGPNFLNTGGRYNPSTNTWTSISTVDAPTATYMHVAAWTGTEMIVWGGRYSYACHSYNPATDTWSAISSGPSGRANAIAVWTGTEVIVWGGSTSSSCSNTGGRYNPSTGIWTLLMTTGAPDPARNHTGVWTGDQLIVWGGDDFTGPGMLNTGGCWRYISVSRSSLAQFESDGITLVPANGSTTDSTIAFKARVADVDGANVKLQVEIQPSGVGFTGTPTSEGAMVASGSVCQASVSGLANGTYCWRARGVNASGVAGPWFAYTGTFRVLGPTISSLGEELAGGGTIVEGGVIEESDVVISATVGHDGGFDVKLQVEMKFANVPFDGTGLSESSLVASGSLSSITFPALSDDSYHWRARAIDEYGGASAWSDFGIPDNVDFIVQTTPATPLQVDQVRLDTGSSVMLGEVIDTMAVRFRVQVTHSAGLKVKVEVRAVQVSSGEVFNVASQLVPSDSWAEVSHSFSNGPWAWMYRTVDINGVTGPWYEFGGNPLSSGDFEVDLSSASVLTSAAPSAAFARGTLPVVVSGTGLTNVTAVELFRVGLMPIAAFGTTVVDDATVNASFDVSGASAGKWSLRLTFVDGSTALLADAVQLYAIDVFRVSPTSVGNSGTVELFIEGDGIREGSLVTLTGPGPSMAATQLNIMNSQTALATFTLDGAQTGSWGLGFEWQGMTAVFNDLVTVVPLKLELASPWSSELAAGQATLGITGQGFEAATLSSAMLIGPDATLPATSLSCVDGNRIEAVFHWDSANSDLLGYFDLVVTEDNGAQATLKSAFWIGSPHVASIEPVLIPDSPNQVVHVKGEGFPVGAVVTLRGPKRPWEETDPTEQKVIVSAHSVTQNGLTFTLVDALPAGLWDLEIRNATGAVIATWLEVPVGSIDVNAYVAVGTLRFGAPFTERVWFFNRGTLPIKMPIRIAGDHLVVEPGTYPDRIEVKPGESVRITFSGQVKRRTELPPDTTRGCVRVRPGLNPGEAVSLLQTRIKDIQVEVNKGSQADVTILMGLLVEGQSAHSNLISIADSESKWATEKWAEVSAATLRAMDDLMAQKGPLSGNSPDLGRGAEAMDENTKTAGGANPHKHASTAADLMGALRNAAARGKVKTLPKELWRLQAETGWRLRRPEQSDDKCLEVPIGGAIDPNVKLEGHSSGAVPEGEPLVYEINFENLPEATLPADRVLIEDSLDVNLDWSTVQLRGVSHPDSLASATVDTLSGKIMWLFQGINLPPNVNPPDGEGWVAFQIWPKTGLPSGTVIPNQALITFDYEDPIETNITSTILDKEAPLSTVTVASAATEQVSLAVSASDADSRISEIWMYESKDGSPYVLAGRMESPGAFVFTAVRDSRYEFYAVAVDSAGNEGISKTAVASFSIRTIPGVPGSVSAKGGCGSIGVDLLWMAGVVWAARRMRVRRRRRARR